MSSNMLSIGLSGLMSTQTALDTTSHNIANASTPGYSRQNVVMEELAPRRTIGGYQGSGVNVTSIKRSYDEFVSAQVRTANSSKNQWDSYSTLAEQVNNLFANSTTGLSTNLQSITSAFQAVANTPTLTSVRQVLLSKADSLVNQLRAYDDRLNGLNTEINSKVKTEAIAITGLASSIANMNEKIANLTVRGVAVPNDLMDQRSRYIDELSSHINVAVVQQDDGQMNIAIGNGYSLVTGTQASRMVAQAGDYVPGDFRLALIPDGGAAALDVTNGVQGGTLGGLLSFRDNLVATAKNNLGQVAVGVASVLNEQQHKGFDLDAQFGTDLFSVGGVSVFDNKNNTGTGSVTVTRSDTAALTNKNYLLTKTSSGWMLQDGESGNVVTTTGTGTSLDPFVADGLSIEVTAGAATGDKFLIRPTYDAVATMAVELTDPRKIAAAAAIVGSANSSNAGTGTISQGVVDDATNASLLTTVTIQFTDSTHYSTDGGLTTQAYTSGDPISMNGWHVEISGAPSAGDVFTVQSNSTGLGDYRNALLMSQSLDQAYFDGGKVSINDTVNNWVAGLGVDTNQAQSNLAVQNAIYDDTYKTQQGISGVNLDEEAANLVRYQQAYAAMSKVIAIANENFSTLMQAFS